MQDEKKTTQLVEELVQLRRQVAALQQGMAETQREASALLETVPLGIHGCDIDGRVTFVNSAHAKLTGYTREEMLGSFIWDRMAPGPQRDSMPSYLKQLAEGQPPPTPSWAEASGRTAKFMTFESPGVTGGTPAVT